MAVPTMTDGSNDAIKNEKEGCEVKYPTAFFFWVRRKIPVSSCVDIATFG
jgi:hypothetical protein